LTGGREPKCNMTRRAGREEGREEFRRSKYLTCGEKRMLCRGEKEEEKRAAKWRIRPDHNLMRARINRPLNRDGGTGIAEFHLQEDK